MNGTLDFRPVTIERLASAVYPSFAMLAGMELDIFTTFKDGPLSAAEVATDLGMAPSRVTPLLYALVAAGLLTSDDGKFANTAESAHFLVRGRPEYIGVRHHAYRRRWQTVLRASDAIRSGISESPQIYAEMPREERDPYYRGLHTEAVLAGRVLAEQEDFARYRNVADVGGGSGGVAIALARAWPHVSATIVDLPATTPVAERNVDEAGLRDRVSVLSADIMRDSLTGPYDVAVLRGVLIVLPPDAARRVLRNLHHAIAPGGAIYVVGWILDDSRVSPPELATYNLQFSTALDEGGVHTESEIRHWLLEVGFRDVVRVRSAPVYASDFIRAYKPS